MKKVILIFALIAMSLSFSDCKKNNKLSSQPDIYCCFYKHNNVRTFYKCAETESEMQQVALEIRNKNLGSLETTRKSECSECK